MSSVKDFNKRINLGNLEANISFLNKTGLINKQKKILEIGSGKGTLLNFFYKNGYDIRGAEKSELRFKESMGLYGNLPLDRVVSETLPYSNESFDIVMSFDVFEHITNSDRHLCEVYRVLKKNGAYLLQTPNKFTNSVFETIRWRSLTKWRIDHCSLHNYWEICQRFKKNNFRVKFYDIPVINDFFKLKTKVYLGNFGIIILKLINFDKFPTYLKTNFYIKAEKIQ